MKISTLFLKTTYLLFLCLISSFVSAQDIVIHTDATSENINFAANEITIALQSRGAQVLQKSILEPFENTSEKHIVLYDLSNSPKKNATALHPIDAPTNLKPEGFAIKITKDALKTTYWVLGADATGTMYGGLELAEIISLYDWDGVKEDQQNPFLEKRGLKLNIPLDARTPSYADASTSAQKNMKEMWSWDFWTHYLDNLARHRYNTITLWSLHPFPSMVKVPEYPDVALADVKRSTMDWKNWYPNYHNSGSTSYNEEALQSLITIKKMSIEEKIVFWQKVMEYADQRGVSFYMITWNVFVSSAGNHYSITRDMDNKTTIDYMRKSVKAMFQTYPLLAGIGVTAGEGMDDATVSEKEEWLWNTYGEGLMDAKREDTTNRTYRFIHRYWWSEIPDILAYFKGFDEDVIFDFSFKYSKARLYSDTHPTFADDALKTLPKGMKFWWNLRNDDIYNFRWADPDYVREFINNFPREGQTLGFHMGSDSYAWGREFTSTEPENPRQLEIEKHWLNFLLWGRMGYDHTMPNVRIEDLLERKFKDVPGNQLLQLWQEASKIIPLVNKAHWHDWDFQWSVEYSAAKSGFHVITEEEWRSGDTQVAAQLKKHANYVLKNILSQKTTNKELKQTLGDIKAMAHLGLYYAEKFLAAEHKVTNKKRAAAHLVLAADHWRNYAAIASSQYTPQLLGRSGWMDWNEIYNEVLKDIKLLQEE